MKGGINDRMKRLQYEITQEDRLYDSIENAPVILSRGKTLEHAGNCGGDSCSSCGGGCYGCPSSVMPSIKEMGGLAKKLT